MPTSVSCNMNAGMERVFTSLDDKGQPVDISKDARYSVFFDIIHPKTPNEQRFLRVVERFTGREKLKVKLIDAGGAKPFNGDREPNLPNIRTNIFLNFPCDIDVERIFLAEVNLSDDPRIDVRLNIFPGNRQTDRKRFLSFQSKIGIGPLDFDDFDTDLMGTGGKKPLGGGSFLRGSLTSDDLIWKYER